MASLVLGDWKSAWIVKADELPYVRKIFLHDMYFICFLFFYYFSNHFYYLSLLNKTTRNNILVPYVDAPFACNVMALIRPHKEMDNTSTELSNCPCVCCGAHMFRSNMERLSELTALSEGNPPVTYVFALQRTNDAAPWCLFCLARTNCWRNCRVSYDMIALMP